jgi:predicted nucleic acid-binding protein
MKIIISDTTALITFAKADILSLLDNLFNTIYIPKSVHNELIIKDDIVKYRIDQFDKIAIKEISDLNILENIKKYKIDKGETEAISLALELNLKLIIDERKGRQVALSQGVSIVGVLGILIENYRQGFINFNHTHYYFELVKKNGLRINENLEDLFYEKLKEIKI